MSSVKIQVKQNTVLKPCPKCGNNTEFTARAERSGEDCCDVWVICKCGFDPTQNRTGHRMEDVWGSLDPDTINCALSCSWNDPIEELEGKATV